MTIKEGMVGLAYDIRCIGILCLEHHVGPVLQSAEDEQSNHRRRDVVEVRVEVLPRLA